MLLRLKMVFWETVWFGVDVVMFIPITDALLVVPVPILFVKFLTVFDVNTAGAFEVWIPIT